MGYEGLKKVIGIDVGGDSLKAVLLERRDQQMVCRDFYVHPFVPGEECSRQTLVEALREVKGRFGKITADATLVSNDRSIQFKFLEKPEMSRENLDLVVANEMQQALSGMEGGDKLKYLYAVLGKGKTETSQTLQLLTATFPNSFLEYQLQLFREAGLRLHGIYTYAIALRECFAENYLESKSSEGEEPALTTLINLGATMNQIVVLEKDLLRLARVFPSGGEDLTKGLAKSYKVGGSEQNLTRDDAENWKRTLGLLSPDEAKQYEQGSLELQVAENLRRGVERVSQKFRLSLDYFKGQAKIPVTQAFLVGGGANLRGISGALKDLLQIPEVLEMLPFIKIPYVPLSSSAEPPAEDLQSVVAVAVGGAICGMKSDAVCMNLLTNVKQEQKRKSRVALASLVGLMITLGAVGSYVSFVFLPMQGEAERLDAEYRKITTEYNSSVKYKNDYDKLITDQNSVTQKNQFLKDSLDKRVYWSKFLLELTSLLPRELWLTEFSTEGDDGKGTMAGQSGAAGGPPGGSGMAAPQGPGDPQGAVAAPSPGSPKVVEIPGIKIRLKGKVANFLILSQFVQRLEKAPFIKKVKCEQGKREAQGYGSNDPNQGVSGDSKEEFLEFTITAEISPAGLKQP